MMASVKIEHQVFKFRSAQNAQYCENLMRKNKESFTSLLGLALAADNPIDAVDAQDDDDCLFRLSMDTSCQNLPCHTTTTDNKSLVSFKLYSKQLWLNKTHFS
jgi:hypothetical protein